MADSSSDECRISEEIKKSVRAVLLSKIGGVPLDRFASDFKKLAGYPLQYKELGFSSLREFLEAIPDAVRFNYSDEASKWMLYGIGDPNSYMSSAAKKAQYSKPGDGTKDTNRKRNRKKSNKSNKDKGDNEKSNTKQTSEAGDRGERSFLKLNTDTTDEEIRVPRSRRGFYSVCVYYKGILGDSRHQIMQEIVELFATQGDVIEKSCVKRLMFFRFLKEEEAISVIKSYNGRCLSDGREIRVTPASEKMPSEKKSDKQFEGKPSRDEQREQQQQLQQLMQQESLQHQQILHHHQMIQEYCEPWSTKDYQFMQTYVGMQEAYLGMHGDSFLEGHMEYNDMEDNVAVHAPSVVEICVFNISNAITKEDLLSVFWGFNPLFVRLRSKPGDGNKRKHFAFVAFGCLDDAYRAEANMQGTLVKGCHIKMEIAKTKAHEKRSPEEQALLDQAKKLNNQKPRRKRNQPKDQPKSCRSEDESNDSISAEISVSDDPDNPLYMDNKIPVIDDSPYSVKTHHLDDTSSSGGSEGCPVPSSQEGGMTFGRGRGSLLGHVSPSLGRGLAMLSGGTDKKKLRPSLADLADKLHEL